MNCQDVANRLIDYAHDELEPDETREVTAHLSTCRDCALAFCQLRADLAGISQAMSETPRPEVRAKLMERVDREFRLPFWKRLTAYAFRQVPAYGLAVAALIPIVIWVAASWQLPERDDFIEGPSEGTVNEPVLQDFDGARALPDLTLL
jgi:anti-sigma factor RsiW